MKCIDLMTIYQTQSCLKGIKDYICIRKVHDRTKRIGTSEGDINLTDYWYEMLESEKNLQGEHIGQHFCLLSDEETGDERETFWAQQVGKAVAICLVKICAENHKVTIIEAQQKMKEVLQDEVSDTKFYRTVDNADLIIFLFDYSQEKLKHAIAKVKKTKYNNQELFYSFYNLEGKLTCVYRDNGDVEYKITGIKIDKKTILQKNTLEKDSWCLKQMERIQEKIDECVANKNRKWASYYQIINQILNLLCQYEQKEKYKDLFYIFYPPMELFLHQLEKGQKIIENNKENETKIKNKTETAASHFVDSMEILIHHIGISCVNILNIDGRNGLPYDIPVKLCMLYLAALHATVKVLNNEGYVYQFCLSPLAHSRPTTNVFDFGLEPEDRLIRVSIARQKLYSPRALLGILTHEVSHYVGNYRERKKRAGEYISACILVVLEMLLPDYEFYNYIKDFELSRVEQKALLSDWKEKKDRIYVYFENVVVNELKRINDLKKHKYHFDELSDEIKKVIGELLYDKDNILHLYMNEVNDKLKDVMMHVSPNSELFDACEEIANMLDRNILKVSIETKIYQRVDLLKYAFKEIYADVSSIQLLEIQPIDYLENYLLSEGYVPDPQYTTNRMINRVAVVNHVMGLNNPKWKEQWKNMDKKALNDNQYLIDLKEKVDSYLCKYELMKSKSYYINCSTQNEVDPFLFGDTITMEIDYLNECVIMLNERLKSEQISKELHLLRAVYRHFENVPDGENSFSDFFVSFDQLLQYFKNDIKEEWQKETKS